MRAQRISTNGTELHVYEHSTAGEPLFLLHPGNTGSVVWDFVIPSFTDQYRVITVDLRGHGESALAPDGYAMENQAVDLVGVFDALEIEAAHIVGNSLGTDVAVYFAAMYPERVKSLVNIDAGMINFNGPGGEIEESKETLVESRRQRPLQTFASREEFAAFSNANWQVLGEEYARYIGEHLPLRVLEDGRVTHQMPPEIAAELMAAWCDMRFETCYPRIQCPVLFMPAEKWDKLAEKLAFIEQVKGSLPYVETVVLEGASHIPLLDHPQAVSKAIHSFLANVTNKKPISS